MKYADELTKSMIYLSKDPKTIFLGQAVEYPGTAMSGTLKNIPKNKLIQYTYPSTAELKKVGTMGLFLGQFLPWDSHENAEIAAKHGFRYYKDNIGEVQKTQYRVDGLTAMNYKLYYSNPKIIDPMALDSNTPDSILKFGCTIAYRGWEVEYAEPPKLSGLNKGRRALNAVMEGLSVASRFGSTGDKLLGKLTKADSNLGKINNMFGGRGG